MALHTHTHTCTHAHYTTRIILALLKSQTHKSTHTHAHYTSRIIALLKHTQTCTHTHALNNTHYSTVILEQVHRTGKTLHIKSITLNSHNSTLPFLIYYPCLNSIQKYYYSLSMKSYPYSNCISIYLTTL